MSYEQRAREWLDTWTGGHSREEIAQLVPLLEQVAAEARGQVLRDVAAAFNGDETWTEYEIRDWLLAAAPDPRPDLRLVAREDLATVIEAAYRWARHIAKGKRHAEAATTRAAINRLRAGEEG